MSFTITTDETRIRWIEDVALDNKLRTNALNSSILLLPIKNFRNEVDFSFPQGTIELFNYLKSEIPDIHSIEICINDEDYREFALYSREIRLGRILVDYLAAPLLVGLLTNYVYGNLNAQPEDEISISISVEHNCKNYEVNFDGTAKDFKGINESINEIISLCKPKIEESKSKGIPNETP